MWQPITDLPSNWADLASAELSALAQLWKEQRATLTDRSALARFNERLAREWAIETGMVERLYTIDRGVTNMLIEQSFLRCGVVCLKSRRWTWPNCADTPRPLS